MILDRRNDIVGALGAAVFTVTIGALPNAAKAAPISGQGTWETTLQARTFDGNYTTVEGYYDMSLGITWLADANYAQTSGVIPNGRMTWGGANAWAAGLNINGITGWRLPTIVDTGTPGCNLTYSGTDCGWNVQTTSTSVVYSEMASMYYDTLGNLAEYDTAGIRRPSWGLTNTGPFSNLQSGGYWSGLEDAFSPGYTELFSFVNGFQGPYLYSTPVYGWAVHTGDIGAPVPAPVPIPAAAWLFGSGLLGLIGVARRKHA